MKRTTTLLFACLAFFFTTGIFAQSDAPKTSLDSKEFKELEAELKELEVTLLNLEIELEKELAEIDEKAHKAPKGHHYNYDYNYNYSYSYSNNGGSKAFLGVYPRTAKGNSGVMINGVVSGKGAEAAGLQEGDIITSIEGFTLKNNDDLSKALAKFEPGDQIQINFLRDGKQGQTFATLTYSKSDRNPCKVFIGVYCGGRGVDGKGVKVTGIIDDTPADEADVQDGDIILGIDGVTTNSFNELLTERNKHNPGDNFVLKVNRDGQIMDVNAQFKACDRKDITIDEYTPVFEEAQPEEPATPREAPKQEEEQAPVLEENNGLQLINYKAFPNPTFGKLNVTFEGNAQPTTIQVFDSNGKTIYSQNINQFDGYFNDQLNLNGNKPGAYFLNIRQGNQVLSKKIVILPQA